MVFSFFFSYFLSFFFPQHLAITNFRITQLQFYKSHNNHKISFHKNQEFIWQVIRITRLHNNHKISFHKITQESKDPNSQKLQEFTGQISRPLRPWRSHTLVRLWEATPAACSNPLQRLGGLCGTEAGDQRGGEWEPIKNFFRNSNCRPMSQNQPNPQAFWPKFGVAIEKLNQHNKSWTSELTHEANRKQNRKTAELICLDWSNRCAGPVWPERWTGLTGRAYRSDR